MRAVNLTDAAFADWRHDFVRPEFAAYRKPHMSVLA
jgi:hypothetical protein